MKNTGFGRENETNTYGLHFPARCISALLGEKQSTMFLVGTNNVSNQDNQVHLFEAPERGEPKSICIFPHPNEIWDLAPCPKESDLLFTTYRDSSSQNQMCYHSSLWRLTYHSSSLEHLTKLDFSNTIRRIEWGFNQSSTVAVLSEDNIALVDIETSSKSSAKVTTELGKGQIRKTFAMAWEPWESSTGIAVSSNNSVQCWDTRSQSLAWQVDCAHTLQIRDIDFNRNLLNTFCTAGDDGSIKFWDYRKTSDPTNVLELKGHSHWVWSAKYNPSYDELLVSASSDMVVNLWDLNDLIQPDGNKTKPDEEWLTKSYCDGDGDSIYSVAWACGENAFIFASLSNDKTSSAVIHRVPQEQIDRILFKGLNILV